MLEVDSECLFIQYYALLNLIFGYINFYDLVLCKKTLQSNY